MSDQNTVRVLTLDGGGIRGIFTAKFLSLFCEQANINPSEIFNFFDIIVGTSIGGSQSVAYGEGKTPDEMIAFFYDKGPTIFDQSDWGPYRKARVVMGVPLTTPPDTFYPQEPLKAAMQEIVGEKTLSEISGNIILTSWDIVNHYPKLFSNITGYEPFLSGSEVRACDAALATAAAPLYFPKATFNDGTYIDGGVIINNPDILGLVTAKRIFPTKKRICLLSVGTAIAWPNEEDLLPSGSIFSVPDNVRYMSYLLSNVFIGGVQKLNSEMVRFYAESIYGQNYYYRFQYQFPPGEKASLDNASIENMDNLVSLAQTKYNQEQLAITNFINHLNL